MWVAKDLNGKLFMYKGKPLRMHKFWQNLDDCGYIELDVCCYPELRWEDEPIEVRITTDENLQELYDKGYADMFDKAKKWLEPVFMSLCESDKQAEFMMNNFIKEMEK